MHQLLLATRNSHKTREFAEILGDGFDVHDLADVAELPVVERKPVSRSRRTRS